ncbi:MAG: DUF371 domain-containing protein [Nanoarchaeota archaeon]|nr:DUF371 domain-containing protein [Nanoarchaeota archaeon]MCK5629467.1 DUF371 domain-containing protein [Nanoarchaeota archaeon]
MSKVLFSCYGHRNILGTHKTTLEFTKDKDLSSNGNCIIGVSADFELSQIKKLLEFANIKIRISVDAMTDEITAKVNPYFNDAQEIVIRLGEYDSPRTLGTRADKASMHIKRKIINKMKNPMQKMIVEIQGFN